MLIISQNIGKSAKIGAEIIEKNLHGIEK